MQDPGNKEVIDALNTILESGILSGDEINFVKECTHSVNPIDFLQKKLLNENKDALSIYYKLDKHYNEMEKQNEI